MIVKNVEKKEKNTAFFQVEADPAEFEAAVNGAYLKNKRNIYIPGFRKGKAPRTVVEGMYGAEVFYQDAMDELAPKAYDFGVAEAELKVVGTPAIADVNVTEERSLVYTFSVSLYPEVTLGQYKGLEAEKKVTQVTEEELQDEMDNIRRRNARMIDVDDRPAQMGDTANIDFDGYLNGERFDGGKAEGYSLELGSNSFVPGFEEQIVGMQVGEEKDIDVTFPENYVQDLAGKAVVFKIKLNGLTYPELPDLDDEFAKDISEFDTLDEYKADLRASIQKRYDDQADAQFRSDIMRQAADNMTAEIPQVMIEEKVEELVRNYAANFGVTDRNMTLEELIKLLGIDEDSMNQTIRPGAEFQVKTELLLDAVVKAEDIQVSDEELEEYLKSIAESVNATPEDIKNYYGTDFVAEEKKKEKATALIMESAVAAAPKAEAAAEDKAE